MVVFDIPITHNTHRKRLRRHLYNRHFGCLQDSLWISPDSLSSERELLTSGEINVESLILMEGKPCAGESDSQLVAGAWNWEQINKRYEEHLKVLEQRPGGTLNSRATAQVMLRWAAVERASWLQAVAPDPLLPECLLPAGYRGCEAWERRVEALGMASRQIRTFQHS